MADIPTILKSGDIARLIPVVADSRKEQRVASVFLATLSAVPELAEALLGSVGQRVGRRTTINSFTEVVFKDKPQDLKDRPDGLLIVDRGRSTWSALIEAKIGNSKLWISFWNSLVSLISVRLRQSVSTSPVSQMKVTAWAPQTV